MVADCGAGMRTGGAARFGFTVFPFFSSQC